MFGKGGLSGSVMAQNSHKLSFLNINAHLVHSSLSLLYVSIVIVFKIIKSQFQCFDDSHIRILSDFLRRLFAVCKSFDHFPDFISSLLGLS